jgi:PAS domain S-box-containing protein
MRIGALKAKRPGAETVAAQLPLAALTGYGLAALFVGLALGASLLLEHFHFRVPAAPLLLFAVAISSWYGGPRPAVWAAILSISAFYWYFVEPVRTIDIYPSEIPYFIVFVAFASLLSWFGTTRRRAEAVLREQASLLNLTHDAVFVMDMEGVIHYWNRGAEERYGWAAEQAVGRVVHDLLKTVFPAPLEQIKAEVMRTGRWEGELVHTQNGGTQIVVASRWALQCDRRGAPVAILETNNDITERKKEELELGKFVSLAENSAEFIGMCDMNLIPFYVNPAGLRLVGLDNLEQAARAPVPELFFPEDRRFITEEFFPRVVREGRAEVEIRFRHFQTGEPIWMIHNVFHIKDAAGRPVGLATVSRDITERKRAEVALHRLNRELRALSDCNQTLLRATDEQSLLEEICRIVCEEAGYRPVWVGYVEHDEAKSMRPVAWAGTDEAYLATARISWSEDTEHGRGPTGTAIRSGKTSCVQDFATDARVAPWRDILLQGGFRSAIALPLKDEHGNTFGTLTMHSERPNAFTPEEIWLLEELAGDLAFGIVTLRSRAARQRAEQEVALLSFALDKIHEAAFLIDDQGRFHYANEEGCAVLGYPRAELLGLSVPDIDPEFPAGSWPDHWRDLKAQRSLSFESRHRTRDGYTFPVEISANYFEYGGRAYNLALVRDITERKRAEQKIQQQEMELRQVLDFTPQLIGMFGPDRERLYANQPSLDYFGVTHEEWKSISDRFCFYHPDDRERIAKNVYTGSVSGVSHEFEARFLRKDGVYRWFLFRDSPLRDEQGRIVRWYITATDIEDRKRAEAERQARVWFLEGMDRINRAMQRTNDLEQMMGDVIDAMLSIFDSDRAFLYYPCDPDAPSFEVVMRRTRPEYPAARGVTPMTPAMARGFQIVRSSTGVVTFGPGCDYPLIGDFAKHFGHQCSIGIAVYPKTDNPWVLAMHQCSYPRVWTPDERRLLEEIARRVEDSLTSLLMFRGLRESEQALRQSEAYLAEAQRLSHTGSWAFDLAGNNYVYVSEECFRIFGFDPKKGTPTGEDILRQIHPEDRGSWEENFEKSLREKVDTLDEYRIVLPDGTMKHVHTTRHPVLDDAGHVVRLVGTSIDITERRRAEEALRRSEGYLTDAQTMTHTGSWAQDGTTRMTLYWSEETYRIWGFDPQQGFPTWDQIVQRIHPQDLHKHQEATKRALFDKADLDFEYRIVLPDGTVKHLHTLAHPVLSPAGEVLEVVGTTVDITDRKRAEQERERLRQLEADLAHIDRVSLLGELAASIAHEVNQPLAGIVSNGGACLRWLAGDAPDVEEVREALRDIVRDGKRAGEVIHRIRSLTRKSAAARERLDLNRTIGEVLGLVGDEAKKRSVTIRTRFAADLLPVLGDQVQLQQVALNLIMNGIEAMSSVAGRARELVITTGNIEPDQVQVTIEDSGVGIDPERIGKIFDSFYTTKPGGMGMGLSISRSILQAHGGRLWATANDGPGTTFHFSLPKYREQEAHSGVATVS